MSSYLNVNSATQAQTTPGIGEQTRTIPDAGERARMNPGAGEVQV
jgi:hypothetical protein